MIRTRLVGLACCAILAASPARLGAQTAADTAQVRAFAQAFYNWYVPIAFHGYRDSTDVLRHRPLVLTRELRTALREDAAADARSRDPGGINFDPFLFSQDPCERHRRQRPVGETAGTLAHPI